MEKAKDLAAKLQIDNFKASDGWLSKRRHNIKLQRLYGESGAADLDGVEIARVEIVLTHRVYIQAQSFSHFQQVLAS